MQNSIKKAIFVLSVVGVLIASYSLYDHYQPTSGGGICHISETLDCDKINKGPFSEIFGIPVSLLGVLFYLTLAALSYILAFGNQKGALLKKAILFISAFGVLFSLSLGTFAYYKLQAICPVCVSSYITIITIFILSAKIRE